MDGGQEKRRQNDDATNTSPVARTHPRKGTPHTVETRELKLSKRRLIVEVAVPGRITNLEVFLSEFAREHSGPERVSDLLNGELDFLPGIGADEKVFLLGLDSILWVRVEGAPHEDDEAGPPTEVDATLRFDDGSELKSTARYRPAPGYGRLLDFLNTGARFIELLSADGVVYVNRRRISLVSVE